MRRFILSTILLSPSIMASVAPENTSGSGPTASLSFFKSIGSSSSLMFNTTFQNQTEIPDQRTFKLSYRYKINKHFKAGFTFQRMFGQRHNEDWLEPTTTQRWRWRDTTSRGENYYYPFIQYNDRFPTLKNTAYKIRFAYRYNQFNKQQDIFLKSGIVSLLSNKFSLLNQINVIIPTSYMRSPVRDYWTYHSLGYHLSPNVTFGVDLSYWKQFWNESLSFRSEYSKEFEVTNTTINYGLFVNLYF